MAYSGDFEWCDAELTCVQEELRIGQMLDWSGSVIVIAPTGHNGQYSVTTVTLIASVSPKDKLSGRAQSVHFTTYISPASRHVLLSTQFWTYFSRSHNTYFQMKLTRDR